MSGLAALPLRIGFVPLGVAVLMAASDGEARTQPTTPTRDSDLGAWTNEDGKTEEDGGPALRASDDRSLVACFDFVSRQTSLSGTIRVKNDAAGSDPYMFRAGSGSSLIIVVELGDDEEDGVRAITISGSAPWVEVSGWLALDESFMAFGSGIVVGGTLAAAVEFTGTYDQEAGKLSGDYALDVDARLAAGHPTVYEVSVTRDDPSTAKLELMQQAAR